MNQVEMKHTLRWCNILTVVVVILTIMCLILSWWGAAAAGGFCLLNLHLLRSQIRDFHLWKQ